MKPQLVATMSGEKALDRKLKELPLRVSKKVTRKAVMMGARIVSSAAKRLVRKGKTRLLSKSIGVKGKQGKQAFFTVIGPRHGFAMTGQDGKTIHDPANIGHLVEGGTQPHYLAGQKGTRLVGYTVKKDGSIKYHKRKVFTKKPHPGARPYPFVKPALSDNMSRVQSTIRSKLWSGIQEEAKSS